MARCGEEGWVDRNGAEYLVSVVPDSPTGQIEASNQAWQPDKPLLIDAPAVFIFQVSDDSFCQSFQRPGIPKDSMVNPFLQGIDNWLRCAEVHVGHPERDDVPASIPLPFLA